MSSAAERAADIHRHMCEDPGYGYSWDERWGGPETEEVCGRELNVGDYDCSSSTITAWRKALEGTPYEGCLDGATYTGNMRRVFTESGLFDWVDASQAERGDLYLNEGSHVAMCQGGGMLSEFSGNEHGGVYGGQRGDQTGWESHVTGYYSYPWDGCLRYNGKADEDEGEEEKMQGVRITQFGDEVRRLYKAETGDHLYTADGGEAEAATAFGYVDEGAAWKSPAPSIPVYSLFDGKDHFYTADLGEAVAAQEGGYAPEGVRFCAANSGVPVFRLYSGSDHFYTADRDERERLVAAGWADEGVAWRV